MSGQEHTDVYANHPDEYYPGIRQRSRPGQAPREEIYDKTKDAYGNTVTDKPANRAILASQRRRLEHESKLKAQRTSKARSHGGAGSRSGKGRNTIWSYIPIILFIPLLSSFLTQTYTFGLSQYYLPTLRRFWNETPLNPYRPTMRGFTPQELGFYDGLHDDRPVYLAIDGTVFDVSANRRIYGKGGSYNMMAGRDASRAFTTGCFETHLTHDTRGLNEGELASLRHWKDFFTNHEKYHKVGYVSNPPLTDEDPIPPPCRAADSESESASGPHGKAGSQAHVEHAPGEAAAKRGRHKPGPVTQ
ncbi:uncharacterized protein I303_100159 [Kwoniella dejecticola CBS 10117]|uniref:Cytochrome b5 heme-binding domain-containing protein n=1 Tax=Kwoniella dejecticola CBS 10117 TaxID=1296121 RepID=A0A1A6AE97_9TREE|nr:uncharacterized protein I303_00160 [Kwoniella dejecticola CBS 10117]OBR88348.1 hypothetical protein I303_00160 [Kwoniella dejecticola CBS 10117]